MKGPCYCEECLARGHRRRGRYRLLYTVVQNQTEVTHIKAPSVTAALQLIRVKTGFKPGARVRVFIPAIVHARRLP